MSAAGDLRLGGQWNPLQHAKNDVLWALAVLAIAATRPLSAPTLRVLGRALGRAAHLFARGARRAATANVARALPLASASETRRLVRRTFVTLGESLGDTVAMLHAPRDAERLPLDEGARSIFAAARAEGRGVVFASAHLGPWERVAASLVAAGVPLVVVARQSYDPRFTRLYERLRGAGGVRVIWRGSSGAHASIVRALRGGEVLGIPMDLRARGVASCDAPFLGVEAPTPIGPARIALRTRAPVVVGTAAPDAAGGLRVTATRIVTGDLGGDDAAARTLTARVNAELSARILAMPHAWPWMHARWSQLGP